jgi:hypothetical protein
LGYLGTKKKKKLRINTFGIVCSLILAKIGMDQQTLVKIPNITFQGNWLRKCTLFFFFFSTLLRTPARNNKHCHIYSMI